MQIYRLLHQATPSFFQCTKKRPVLAPAPPLPLRELVAEPTLLAPTGAVGAEEGVMGMEIASARRDDMTGLALSY